MIRRPPSSTPLYSSAAPDVKKRQEENIKKLKIKLPEAADPIGSYAATKISGKQIFISGQISIDENGKLNGQVS